MAKGVGFGGLDKYVCCIVTKFDIIIEKSGCGVIFGFVGRCVFRDAKETEISRV